MPQLIYLNRGQKMYPNIDKVATGKSIKENMNALGISTRQLQKYLGLSCVQTIYRWLEGENVPSIDNLYAMSQLFHKNMDELICGDRKGKITVFESTQLIRLRQYSIQIEKYKN